MTASTRLTAPTVRRRRLSESPALPAAILFVASLALAVVFWPGHMDADALNQIGEARTGVFNDWWSPVLDWLWRGLFLLHLSPGFVLWGTILVFLLSVYQLFRLGLRRRSAIVATLLLAVFPPVFGFLGSLQRDVWFGTATLAAYALLVRAQKATGAHRRAWAAGSLLAIWVGLAARQNALLAVVPAAVVATGVILGVPAVWRRGHATGTPGRGRWGRSARTTSVGLVAVTLILLGILVLSQRLLTYDVIGATRTYPQQNIFEGDLASISVRENQVLEPASIFPSQNLQVLRAHYSPYGVLSLISGPDHPLVVEKSTVGPGLVDAKGEHQLREDWLKAIYHHPRGYLHARWKQWTRLIAWSGNAHEPYHPGIDRNPWGYKATFPALDRFALAYLSAFSSGPLTGGALQRIWVYLLVSSGLAVDLLRGSRPKHLRLVGWLCGAAVVYYLAFFFVGMGPSFRWAWLLVTATVIGLCLDANDRIHCAIERRVHAIAESRTEAPPRRASPEEARV